MRAVKILPPNYQPGKILDLSSARTSLWMNIGAIPLLFIYVWLFSLIFASLQPVNLFPNGLWSVITLFSIRDWLFLLASVIFILVLHEVVHGICFWIFTKERPKFGLRGGYAFASAPEWYLPKFQYGIVGLAPFFVISILGIILSPFIPAGLLPYLLVIISFNAAGALGDMIVVAWIIRQANTILVRDQGDKFLTFNLETA
jgi:hypothetical protein